MLLNPGQKIGKMRYERIVREVAPLACRGATSEEIAQTLGISPSMARKTLKRALRSGTSVISTRLNAGAP